MPEPVPGTTHTAYTPAPGTATCPHCGHAVAGISDLAPYIELASYLLVCPRCAYGWSEHRCPRLAVIERSRGYSPAERHRPGRPA